MMKKTMILVLLSLLIACNLSALSFDLGLGMTSEKDFLDDSSKSIYKNMNSQFEKINWIERIGPYMDFTFYPLGRYLGVQVASETLFPIGYGIDELKGYKMYNLEFKENAGIFITSNLLFSGNSGLYLGFGANYSYARMADENHKNDKTPVIYYSYQDVSLLGKLGIITEIEDGFFRFGLAYGHSLINDGFTINITASGGFKF